MKIGRRTWLRWSLSVAVATGACLVAGRSIGATETAECTAVPIVESGLPSAVIVVGEGCTDLEQRAARLLQKKIAERTGCELPLKNASEANADAAKNVRIAIVICPAKQPATKGEADRKPNGFTIASSEQAGVWRVEIRGDDPLGTLFGVGRLLREVDFTDGGARLSLPLRVATAPAYPMRGPFLANHLQDVTYKYWSLAEWRDYLEEIALSGCNTVFFLPLQQGQTKAINDAIRTATDPPRTDFWADSDNVFTGGTPADREAFWSIRAGVCRVAHELGLAVGIYVGPNDIFLSEFLAHPEIQIDYKLWPTEQAHVCASTPLGRQLILEEREELFKRLPYLDYVWVPSADYGGCGCEKCFPWVRTYIELTREIAERLRRHHPNAKFCISNQGGPPKPGVDLKTYLSSGQYIGQEEDWLRRQLREDKLPWVDVLIYACSSPNDIADVFHEIAPRLQVVDLTFDITMTCGWGNWAANPLPKAIAEQVATRQKFSVGSAYYSEGVHDDLNKFVWTQLLWDPNRAPDDILAEYARYHFGKAAEQAVVQAAWQMEQRNPAERLAQAGRTPDQPTGWDTAGVTRDSLRKAAEHMPEAARNQWRWKLLMLRASLDRLRLLVQKSADAATPLSEEEKQELTSLKTECRRLGDEIWTQISYRPRDLGNGLLKD